MTATTRSTYVPQKTNAAVETYASTIATVTHQLRAGDIDYATARDKSWCALIDVATEVKRLEAFAAGEGS